MTCWQGRGEKWSIFPQDPPRSLLTAVRTLRAPVQPQNSSSPAPHPRLARAALCRTRALPAPHLRLTRASPAPRPRRTVPHPRLARAAPAWMRTCALPAPPHPRRTRASPVPHPSLARAAHAARLRLLATIGYLQILVKVIGSEGLDARSAFRKF